MNELIKINTSNPDRPTVLGRELHEALEVKTAYKDWFPRMCEYGFTEGEDFNLLKIERVATEGTRHVTRVVDDAQLTIPMAKEICMLQRTEKGKECRQYFIKVEEAWNTPEMIVARAHQILQARLDDAINRVAQLESKVETDRPKVLFADAVSASDTTILIGDLAKLISQHGVDIGQRRLFQWMRDNGYLIRREGTDRNMPTQRAMELGLFSIKETAITCPDGRIRVTKTVRVTGKGQQYFINKFLDK
jgi:anti-repressor protein